MTCARSFGRRPPGHAGTGPGHRRQWPTRSRSPWRRPGATSRRSRRRASRLPPGGAQRRLVAAGRRPHRPHRADVLRGAGAVPAGRVVLRPVRRARPPPCASWSARCRRRSARRPRRPVARWWWTRSGGGPPPSTGSRGSRKLQGAVVRRRQVTVDLQRTQRLSRSGPSTRGHSSTRATSGTWLPAHPPDAGRSGSTGSSRWRCSTPRRPGPTTSMSPASGSRWSTRSSSAAGA